MNYDEQITGLFDSGYKCFIRFGASAQPQPPATQYREIGFHLPRKPVSTELLIPVNTTFGAITAVAEGPGAPLWAPLYPFLSCFALTTKV